MISLTQFAAMVVAVAVVVLVSLKHKELRAWFRTKEGFQSLAGLPDWAPPLIFGGAAVLIFAVYVAIQEGIKDRAERAANPFGINVSGVYASVESASRSFEDSIDKVVKSVSKLRPWNPRTPLPKTPASRKVGIKPQQGSYLTKIFSEPSKRVQSTRGYTTVRPSKQEKLTKKNLEEHNKAYSKLYED